ncbi:MAG: DUF47 family protein [Nanoarchaeota archaeon]
MKNVFRWMVPSENKFFDMLSAEAKNLHEAAVSFRNLVHDYNKLSAPAREKRIAHIKHFENKGDDMAHAIINELNKSFITPFDSEDVHELAMLLDDVIDIMNYTSKRLAIYKIKSVDKYMIRLSDLLYQCIVEVQDSVVGLHKMGKIQHHNSKIDSLEKKADDVKSEAIAYLFSKEPNAVELIKRKEIIEALENATDKCARIARVIDGVIVKHG